MKKYAKPIALLLAVVMCIGIMTACTSNAGNDEDDYSTDDTGLNTNISSDDDSGTDDAVDDGEEEIPSDLVGKVSSVTEESIYLTLYESDVEEIDFASLDLSTLTATGGWEEIAVTAETTYWVMAAGTEVSALFSDITVDAMIAVTQDEYGTQKILILEQAEHLESEENNPIFAAVDSISEEGTLTLMLYTSENTDVLDYTAVDWSGYTYAFDTMDYIIPDDAIIQLVGEQTVTAADSSAITEGAMLVIYQGSAGLTEIFVYQSIISAE